MKRNLAFLLAVTLFVGAGCSMLGLGSSSVGGDTLGPLTGKYEGRSGGQRFGLEVHDGGRAVINLQGNPPIETTYTVHRHGGELLIVVRLAEAGLVFAQVPGGLEMRSASDVSRPVVDRRGSTKDARFRRVGDVEPAAVEEPSSTEPAAPPLPLAVRADTADDRHDLSHLIAEDASDLPTCPPGTSQEMKAARMKGVPVRSIVCQGPQGPDGPMLIVTQERVKLVEGEYEAGQKSGRWVYRSPRGNKTQDGTYARGKKHGLWLVWSEDGSFSHQELWDNGELKAKGRPGDPLVELPLPAEVAEFSCPEGAVQKTEVTDRTHFKWCERSGRKDGPAVGWLPTGQLVWKAAFEDGKETGALAMWFPEGQLQVRAQFVEGLIDGRVLNWHLNGTVAGERFFDMGMETGTYKEWNEAGGLVVEGQYEDGKRHGTWQEVTETGLSTQVWDHGNLVRGRVQGLFGDAPVASRFPGLAMSMLEQLAGVHGAMTEYVMVEAIIRESRDARRRIDKAGHEAQRQRVCEELGQVKRRVSMQAASPSDGAAAYADGIQAFCNMQFSPDRNPTMGSSPVLAGCTMTNAGGRVEKEGPCVEVTPDACVKTLTTKCR